MIGGRLVNGHRNYCSIYEAPRCPLIYGSCLSVAPSDENLSILVTFHRQPNTTILHLCCWARSTHKHSRSYSELQWSAPSKLIHFAKRIVPVHRKTSSLQLPVARASRQSNLADARIFSLLVVPRLPVTTPWQFTVEQSVFPIVADHNFHIVPPATKPLLISQWSLKACALRNMQKIAFSPFPQSSDWQLFIQLEL